MLYVGIDQHTRQLTVCVRDESGEVVMRKQVGTHPQKVTAFLDALREQSRAHGGFVVILEVCGFNDWLIEMLEQFEVRRTVVIQPEKQSKCKTDRRDANRLSEVLWVNRDRLLDGRRVQGVRVVELPDAVDAEHRQITALRKNLAAERTRIINKIKRFVHKHNLIHEQPTRTFQTRAVRRWLREIEVPRFDRLEIDVLLTRWELIQTQLEQVQSEVERCAAQDRHSQILLSIFSCGAFTALGIASRIGRIERFRRGRSLANFFGLTPSCSNSGQTDDRLGHITKQGSGTVRFLLGQLVTRVLRQDPHLRAWYRSIKRRRGAKIARVAVMRKLSTRIWQMLKQEEPYLADSHRSDSQRPRFNSLPASRPGQREEPMPTGPLHQRQWSGLPSPAPAVSHPSG